MKIPMRLPFLLAFILVGLCAKTSNIAAAPFIPPGLTVDPALIRQTSAQICPDIEASEETKQACFWPGFFCIADTKSRIENYLDNNCSFHESDDGWYYHCDAQETQAYKTFLKSLTDQPSAALKLAKDCHLNPDKYNQEDEIPVKPIPTPVVTPVSSPTPDADAPEIGGEGNDEAAGSTGGCSIAPSARHWGCLPLGLALGILLAGGLRSRKHGSPNA